MVQKKKKKTRPRKFKTVTFKLTVRQKKSLDKYSKARNMTPLKLIKRAIETYTSMAEDAPMPQSYTTENQLDLFEEAELASAYLEEMKKSADQDSATDLKLEI